MIPFAAGSPASEPLRTQLNQTFDNGSYQSRYHVFADGLDPSRPVGLMIFADGSGGEGFTDSNSSYQLDADGQDGLVAVARKHNLVLITPLAPAPGCTYGGTTRAATGTNANCWYDRDNARGKAQWSSDLLHHVKSQFGLQPSPVVVGGFSSGAQWATQFFAPAHAEEHSVDLTVAIGYGGAPVATPRFSETFKAQTALAWDTGTADNAYRTDPYGSVGGYNWYTSNGFTTQGTWPEGVDHPRPGQFDRIMDREITRFLGRAAGSS